MTYLKLRKKETFMWPFRKMSKVTKWHLFLLKVALAVCSLKIGFTCLVKKCRRSKTSSFAAHQRTFVLCLCLTWSRLDHVKHKQSTKVRWWAGKLEVSTFYISLLGQWNQSTHIQPILRLQKYCLGYLRGSNESSFEGYLLNRGISAEPWAKSGSRGLL